jgi:hypothetical protein
MHAWGLARVSCALLALSAISATGATSCTDLANPSLPDTTITSAALETGTGY